MKSTDTFAGIAAVALAAALAGPAAAQQAPAAGPRAQTEQAAPDAAAGFAEMDADGDGMLTSADLVERDRARFARADSNGDGSVDAAELAALETRDREDRALARAERRLAALDASGDGMLSADELAGPQAGRRGAMLRMMDTDWNGEVTAEEFAEARDMMRSERGERRGHGRKGRGDGFRGHGDR